MIMRIRSLLPRRRIRSLSRDRRGVAAAEFALIAPALIFMIMGVFEMSFRFRAAEEATRYVHQVADLISRETGLTTAGLDEIYAASVHMMKPLDNTDDLDVDVSSIAFVGDEAEPDIYWRRVAGAPTTYDLADAEGMGIKNESVIRVGIRYHYQSILSNLFGGAVATMERAAYARPRVERLITLDGQTDDGGAIAYFGN
jgi:Flp pilus assembly protein TadG